ncbi:YoaK family protein [Neorhizobium alkalisoli]|uniref:Uncharacterized membrane protein YoaK (UPF0700 family) n=1 Tax=Neorhizobium alkalisoli TaxID=528178 RepID=A0A561QPP3_9HYPH|nr:YoaK family protein [Neorhizobium alkalisoli]TWF52272.1 uncharacterized membrane protein YoaK (UPF0700 family) [Neorhizobium alkalisoli]
MKNIPLAVLLALNAGYVDTSGFLALQGLFTAHVTGNFVTLGATVALGTAGGLAKILALPVFCLVVFLSRLTGIFLQSRNWPVLRPLLVAKLVLLIGAAVLAVTHGPFDDGNALATVVMGMILVTAMAIQNALHRLHLGKSPPSTLMTGTTTQIMIDLAEIVSGSKPEEKAASSARIKKMLVSVVAFAAGCALSAGAFIEASVWCFVVPPVFALLALVAKTATPEGD